MFPNESSLLTFSGITVKLISELFLKILISTFSEVEVLIKVDTSSMLLTFFSFIEIIKSPLLIPAE